MNSSKINFETLINKPKHKILERYLRDITIDKHPKEKKTQRKKPDLKIYILRSYNLKPNQLIKKIETYYRNQNDTVFRKFIDRHNFKVTDLKNSNFYLKIENTYSRKKHHFLIFLEESYWILITLIKKEDLKSTFMKIVKRLPQLEKVKITPHHLEELIYKKQYKEYINGFIAKFKPYHSERKITVNVYGGDLKDLEKIQEIYFVEPTKFEYSLKNSPEGLVEGRIFTDGYFTLKKIKKGYHDLAIQTIQELTDSFKKINELNYESVENYENCPVAPKNKTNTLTFKSRYRFVLKIKEKRISQEGREKKDTITFKELDKKILSYFKNKNRGQRYEVYSEKQYSHFLCDKRTRNKIQLTIEPKDSTIILYPFKNCKGLTIRDICDGINRIESSIEALKPVTYAI